MFNEIVTYLYWFDNRNFHSLNKFLQEKFSDVDLADIRAALVNLVSAKRIEIENDTHKKLNNHSRINQTDDQNTFRDLTNLPINARLTDEEREKMQPNMRDQEQELIELANNFVIYCAQNNLQNVEIDYYPTATTAAIPNDKQRQVLNTLYNRLHLIEGGGIAKKVKIKFKPKLKEYIEALETKHFENNGTTLIAKPVNMDIKDTCEIIFQKHLEHSPVIWVKGAFDPSPQNLYPARDKMIYEGIIFKTGANVFSTLIAHEYENATSYKEAIEIRKELSKPKPTSLTTVTTYGAQSPAMVGGDGATQTTTNNPEPKAQEKKHWITKAFDWVWEQIKKPIVAAISAYILGFFTPHPKAKEDDKLNTQSQPQSTTQQATGDTLKNVQRPDTGQNH